MRLFNPKTIRSAIDVSPLPPDHLAALTEWSEMIRSGRIRTHKETALHGTFAARIVEGVLGYRGPTAGDEQTVSAEQGILRGAVDLALGRFGGPDPRILAPFELKGADTRDLDAIMPGRGKTPVQQAWEYAVGVPGAKWVLVSNMLELRLYAFGGGIEAYESFDLARLTEPEEYARFMLLLSADRLLTGATADLLEASRRADKDITDDLYRDYKALRGALIEAIATAAPSMPALDRIATAQKILDRVLFVAFAEDTGLLPDDTLASAYEAINEFDPQPIWRNFLGLFGFIDRGRPHASRARDIPRYNGGLFRPDPLIDDLMLPDAVCEGFRTLGGYDFASEVSVTVLGHIFEQSISDVERLQASARGEDVPEARTGTSGRRKRDGVVYTPDYIARFITDRTLGAHMAEAWDAIVRPLARKGSDPVDYASIVWRRKGAELEAWTAYRDRLASLRIVDPACGSGVFLVMAFDWLKAELTRATKQIDALGGRLDLFDPDSQILTDNLYGVDVNDESVEITKLSLWIKTARRGKVLDSLSGNIRTGDSLIEDASYAYLDHGFSWKGAFPEIMEAEGGFDVVLGNPPYVRMERLKAMKPYLERRYEVVSDRADLYAYFFERGLRLLRPGGRLGFISSNTFFKTGSGAPLRRYLRRQAAIESVVDFGDLQVFEGVTTYPAILTMRKGAPDEAHELAFWNVESLDVEAFGAAWEANRAPYPQAALTDGSWELENPALRALREKIRAGRPTLKEVYGSPLYGIKTGLNAAFVIDTPTRDRIVAQDPNSAKLLKPFLEGKDLKRWRAEPRGLWLIYIPKGRVRIDDYPAVRDWLLPFREALEKRATKQEWFELQQAQEAYAPSFEGPKIAYGHFQNERSFMLDTAGAFANNKIYFVPTDDWALLALMNSTVLWFDFAMRGTAVRNGWREAMAQYIEPLPIPDMTPEERSSLADLARAAQDAAEARLALQTALARRIPDLCPPGREPKMPGRLAHWWELPDFAAFRAEVRRAFKQDVPLAERSDWEDWLTRDRRAIDRLTAEIAAAEAEIDRVVYGLFGLTEDEIALVDQAV
jgi:hypothetical protein